MKENVENGFEDPVELRTAVRPPHFEDRIVVLTAQPVVPLAEIHTKVRLRRLWFLVGAFAVAMMLGAASALLAVQIKRVAADRAASEASQPQVTNSEEPPTATLEVDTTAAAQLNVTAGSALPEEVPEAPATRVDSAPKRQPSVPDRPRPVDRDRETRGGRGVQPSEKEELEQIRDAVLYERWQERRARRATRRERRNRGDRDLSQVDEIFEGRRRPDRP